MNDLEVDSITEIFDISRIVQTPFTEESFEKFISAHPTLPYEVDSDGETMLHQAVLELDVTLVKCLVKLGVDVNLKEKHGLTPLNMLGHPSWCPRDYISDIEEGEEEEEAEIRMCDIVKYLVEGGADVNTFDNKGRTPLHYAVLKLYSNVFGLLIGYGARIDAMDKKGLQPIHNAARMASVFLIEYLCAVGANIYAKTFKEENLLHIAAKGDDEKYTALVKYLLEEWKFNPEALTTKGKTPLDYAYKNFSPSETIELLGGKVPE